MLMSNPKLIYDYLEINECGPICDDCLTSNLGLARRQQVQPVTATLELTPLYHRWKGECQTCFTEKLVIERIAVKDVRL